MAELNTDPIIYKLIILQILNKTGGVKVIETHLKACVIIDAMYDN